MSPTLSHAWLSITGKSSIKVLNPVCQFNCSGSLIMIFFCMSIFPFFSDILFTSNGSFTIFMYPIYGLYCNQLLLHSLQLSLLIHSAWPNHLNTSAMLPIFSFLYISLFLIWPVDVSMTSLSHSVLNFNGITNCSPKFRNITQVKKELLVMCHKLQN